MKPKQRVLFALLSAMLLAGICTFVLNRSMLHASAAGQTRMLHYSTPTRAIHPGDLIGQSDIQDLPWPATDTVRGAVARREEILNRVSLANIAPGQPIVEALLAPPGSGTGLAARIPNGLRAIALKSDEVIGVAGFLNPGSHVDVLVTCHNGFGMDAVTSTVLQNVEVVATNQQTEPNPNGKPNTATVVTLLLTPSQAQRALLASNQGSLQFVLRNSSDGSTSAEAPVTLSQISALTHEPLPAGTIASAPVGLSPVTPSRRSNAVPHQGSNKMAAEAGGVEMVFGGRSSQPAAPDLALAGGKL